MEKFTINGRTYQAKEIDFNFVCLLEVEGIELAKMGKSFMNILKVYAAYCMDADSEYAGSEINQHIINGGKLDDLTEIVSAKMDESDFFRAISKNEEETDGPSQKKTTKKGQEESE